jgi:glutamine---fructose-6-phosphate transaminase (isomerizing)
MASVTARKGAPIVICCEGDQALKEGPNGPTFVFNKQNYKAIVVPGTVDCLQGILNIIPLPLLRYHLAIMKGFDVHFPRNLWVFAFFDLANLTLRAIGPSPSPPSKVGPVVS